MTVETVSKTTQPSVTRIFDDNIGRVWKMWADPALVKKWHGFTGYTAPVIEMDFRIGGKYLTCMRSPNGVESWSAGVYREIIPSSLLVFTHAKGKAVPESHYGPIENISSEEVVMVTFEGLGGRTRMTLRHGAGPQAWNQSLDKFSAALMELE